MLKNLIGQNGLQIITHLASALAGAGLQMSLSASEVTDVRPVREFLTIARETGVATKTVALNPSGVIIAATLLTGALLAVIYGAAKFAPSMARFAALRFVPREEAAHAGETIKAEAKRFLAGLRNFGQANDHFTKVLVAGSARLATTEKPDQLRSIVSNLVEENEVMRQQSVELKGQIYDTERRLRDLRKEMMKAEELARVDPLTGVGNRRTFDQMLVRETANAAADNVPLSLIMCDIDHFKSINDTHGHKVGDEVLKLFAALLKRACRPDDIVARYGGEEFGVIMPKATSSEASAIANKLRKELGEQSFVIYATGEKLPPLTASFGVAQWQQGEHEDAFVMRTDRILYLAKSSGRNQVMISPN